MEADFFAIGFVVAAARAARLMPNDPGLMALIDNLRRQIGEPDR